MAVAGYELRVNGGSLVNEIIDVGNVLQYDIENPPFNIAASTTYAVEVRAYDEAGNRSAWSAAVSDTTDVPSVPPTLLQQISCGRTAGGTISGWIQDAQFTGGSGLDGEATYGAFTPDLTGLTNPAPAAVYKFFRFESAAGFEYDFSGLNSGKAHLFRLHFCELNPEVGVGQRITTVNANAVAKLIDFDVVAAVGAAQKGSIQEFTVAAGVTDINLEFIIGTGAAGHCMVNGIEIYEVN